MKPGAASDFPPATVPATNDWDALRKAATKCRACPLWKCGTQTVFGEGSPSARIILIGEQPGDQEDKTGKPFVGPAGHLLDQALAEAGIERESCYVTNAVKHFKWEPRGKRRLHKKPSSREIAACRPWLEAELRLLDADAVICLGATATGTLLGPKVRILRDRGKLLSSPLAPRVIVTIHPSFLLRMPDREEAKLQYDAFVSDLRQALATAEPSLPERTRRPRQSRLHAAGSP